jgi:hypothetical protein
MLYTIYNRVKKKFFCIKYIIIFIICSNKKYWVDKIKISCNHISNRERKKHSCVQCIRLMNNRWSKKASSAARIYIYYKEWSSSLKEKKKYIYMFACNSGACAGVYSIYRNSQCGAGCWVTLLRVKYQGRLTPQGTRKK